jgi:hypothetical protein
MKNLEDQNTIDLREDGAEVLDEDFDRSVSVVDVEQAPNDKVKISFAKFVNLVANHAYEEVVERHTDSEIIISTDLLADLANAREDREDKKYPLLLAGAILGALVVWFILKI